MTTTPRPRRRARRPPRAPAPPAAPPPRAPTTSGARRAARPPRDANGRAGRHTRRPQISPTSLCAPPSPLPRSRRKALWQDFADVVDAAAAEGALAPAEAAELRRLAYAGAGVLAEVYGGGAGPAAEPSERAAFLARARRALEAAAAASEGLAVALPAPGAAIAAA